MLRLAHPTISAQIHILEDTLGEKLFIRRGRNLVMTDAGRVAFRYADQIYSLGEEFLSVIKGQKAGRPVRLVVGVSDALAKSIVHMMLSPAFGLEDELILVCRMDRSVDALIEDLGSHKLDLVLADAPAGSGAPARVFSHLLGECGTSFFAAPQLATACRRGFPRSIDRAPFVLAAADSAFRRLFNEWFDSHGIKPKVVGELDDAALAKILSEQGVGIIAVPDVVEADVKKRYKLHIVGRAPTLRQRFYAISAERKITNPAVVAICETARKQIFA